MLAQDRTLLLIGQVARASGIPIKTIRYYEELGLLKSLDRTEGKFRLFTPNVLTRLAFIKRVQALGLSLQEIRECLQIYDWGDRPCDEIKQKLEDQLVEIDQRIEQLMVLRQELNGILKGWNTQSKQLDRQADKICPILQRDT
jgi:MerR family transcriptional regulator, copper efflux regulator